MKSIARKNKLFIKLQKRFYAAAFNDYKKYRNFLNRVIKSAKQNHSNEAAKVNKNNQDQTWKIIKCSAQLKSKIKAILTELKTGVRDF